MMIMHFDFCSGEALVEPGPVDQMHYVDQPVHPEPALRLMTVDEARPLEIRSQTPAKGLLLIPIAQLMR